MSERTTPQPNFRIYFAGKPDILESYDPSGPVTRARFASMLAKSFALSLGDTERQIIYLAWVQARSQFPWEEALYVFQDSGGWDQLSTNEQRYFMDKFNTVRGHETAEDGKVWRDVHNDPGEELDIQITGIFDVYEQQPTICKEFEDNSRPLGQIMTEQELLRELNRLMPRKPSA